MAKRTAGDELRRIPGVGPSIARDLRGLGIRRVADLKGRDPEELYEESNRRRGQRQDPCLLYVFRCAVYFASTALSGGSAPVHSSASATAATIFATSSSTLSSPVAIVTDRAEASSAR